MNKIRKQRLEEFISDLSSSSPTPGGGSAAAVAGSLAAALVEMVASLTLGKKGYEKVEKRAKSIKLNTGKLKEKLLTLADQDALAFEGVLLAYRSKDKNKIKKALIRATEVPREVLSFCREVEKLAGVIAKIGNKNALSDARSAIHLSQAAQKAAYENIKINEKELARMSKS